MRSKLPLCKSDIKEDINNIFAEIRIDSYNFLPIVTNIKYKQRYNTH